MIPETRILKKEVRAMITIQDIKGFKLVNGLDETELNEVANLCKRKTFQANAVIFEPEKPSDELFIVEGGNDAIQIEIPLGIQLGKIVIHTLSKGETFGWAAIESQHVKTATARCLESVSLIAIDGKALLQLFEKNTHMGYIVMKNLCDTISMRLAYTTVAFRHELRKVKSKAQLEKQPDVTCECV
jgi:CRP/FNR family transcriptional regulator, cyclic AMP receptor protein